MLRIQKKSAGGVIKLRLSGRIQSHQVASIQSELDGRSKRKILDLSEVTLVDLAVVRFLIDCENDGVKLRHTPPYIREWMLRERAEEGRSASSSNIS